MKTRLHILAVLLLASVIAKPHAVACTNFLVTKGASADGSVIITYTCDGEFHPRMRYLPAEDHEGEDAFEELTHWTGEVVGKIRQVPHTYAVVQLMNEHQVAIGETTWDGREELHNPDGMLHYWMLMRLALQRAKTAREAIETMGALVAAYGYRSTGESMVIADPDEAWIMEIVGPGKGGTGAIWVALKVPDGSVCAYANKSRIGAFPLDDPENCLYSPDVISFAVEQGYYDPESGVPFSFRDAYCPASPQKIGYTSTRVWSLYNRCAPSLGLTADYSRAAAGAAHYPLWITPDEKLTMADVFDLMRDHYEGTALDMTKGVDAGPFGTPNRWRPMTFTVDDELYSWERPISTQQTGFSIVAQSRSWLPDPVGGVLWYGVDDTDGTCYVPMYCGIDQAPEAFTRGSFERFSWDSAWWIFNLVANYANLKYAYMIEDIREVQSALEGRFLAQQPAVDATALALHRTDPALMTRYLTDYSASCSDQTVKSWQNLAEHLITKYNDGYVRNEKGRPEEVGYPEDWLRHVLELRPEQFKLDNRGKAVETELSY